MIVVDDERSFSERNFLRRVLIKTYGLSLQVSSFDQIARFIHEYLFWSDPNCALVLFFPQANAITVIFH